MRFGIQTVQAGTSYEDLLAFWRFLDRETLFESIWLMDHLVQPVEELSPHTACFESWSLLAAAAQATERLRLGVLVSANTFRHPALLAKMAATIDHVSCGRLYVGIGAGWHEAEHRAFGIHLGSMRERQDRLEEAAALWRAVLDSRGPVSFHGAHYQLEDASFAPSFVQDRPPLVIGGIGERRTLRTAARFADAANLMGPVSRVRRCLDVLRRHCDAVDRDYDTIEKTLHVPLFVDDDPAAVDAVVEFLTRDTLLPAEVIRTELPVGSPDAVSKCIEELAELGITALWFPALAPFAPDRFARLSETLVRAFA